MTRRREQDPSTARFEPDATAGDVFRAPAMCNAKTLACLRARPAFADASCCIHFEQSHTIWSTDNERGARLGSNAHRQTRRAGAQIPGRAGVAQGARGRRLGLGAVIRRRRRPALKGEFDPANEFLGGKSLTRQGVGDPRNPRPRKGCNPPSTPIGFAIGSALL